MTQPLLFHKTYLHPTSNEWVVFVHGAGGSSSIWFKQIKAYKQHFNLLLIDLRGHGKSNQLLKELITSHYTFTEVTQDILKSAGSPKNPVGALCWHVVGYDHCSKFSGVVF